MQKLFDKLGTLPRWFIYLMLSLGVSVPLIWPLNLPLSVSSNSKAIYDKIESLPDSSAVLICFDFDPTSIPECQPMAIALCRHVMKRGLPLIVYTNYPPTPPIADRILTELGKEYNRKYGTDYVNLGFKTGNDVLLLTLGSSWTAPFPQDHRGFNTDTMTIFKRYPNYKKHSFMVDIAHGATVDFFINIGHSQFGVPMACGVTAVSIPQYKAYIQSGQLVGMLGGLKGAAEYEKLVGAPGKATIGMDAQSMAHLVIVGFVLLGNIALIPKWWSRWRQKGNR